MLSHGREREWVKTEMSEREWEKDASAASQQAINRIMATSCVFWTKWALGEERKCAFEFIFLGRLKVRLD